MDYILLHHSPDRLFKPICFVLETWDTSDEYGAGQAMEIFGGILLSLQTIVSRHSLQRSFARFGYGICATIVAPTETLSKPYSLHTLSPQQQGLVSSWIAALYGSEGIEDDLIRNTPPRTMLALAPTIVHQSMIALERGIVDQETLLSGLSYFCQDFLTYTLPSIISYLARQAQPNLTIIKSLIFSESTPACVLELAQDDLRSMTKKLGTDDPDIGLLEKRLQRPDAAVEQELRSTTEIGGAYSVQRLRSAVHERGSQAVLSSIIEGNDPFMASCLATLAFGTDTSTAMQDFVIYAVKRAESLDETAKQAELDKLADYIGLACLRADVDKTVSIKTFHNDVIGRMNLWMDDKV